MAYWWVNQKKTHKLEHAEGYLWAPLLEKGGNTNKHWELMEDVNPGDLIFSYVNAAIVKVAVAQTKAHPAPRPEGRAFDPWKKQGRRITVEYSDLPSPLPNALLLNELGHALQGSGIDRPLTEKGGGKQAYFFALQPEVGRRLLELSGLDQRGAEDVLTELTIPNVANRHDKITTAKRVGEARKGQNQFRKQVLAAWRGGCAVTGCKVLEAVRASHIKPWSDSNNQERLDPHNGLPLLANLDALFDEGLISFSDTGTIEIHVSQNEWASLGLQEEMQLRQRPSVEMRKYLDHHRKHVVN